MIVSIKRNRLDAALAEGADPAASRALDLRAAQLRTRAERERLAAALAEAVADARTGRDSSEQLMALAARLRSRPPMDVRGAAMVARLVDDRLHRTGGNELRDAVADAHSAVIPAHAAAHDVREAA